MASDKHVARMAQEIVFADNEVRTVRPLTIKRLRKFVKTVQDLNVEDRKGMDDEAIDQMVNAAQIVMEEVDPELAADRDRLEESIDLDVFNKMMTAAMGNKISDPNE